MKRSLELWIIHPKSAPSFSVKQTVTRLRKRNCRPFLLLTFLFHSILNQFIQLTYFEFINYLHLKEKATYELYNPPYLPHYYSGGTINYSSHLKRLNI